MYKQYKEYRELSVLHSSHKLLNERGFLTMGTRDDGVQGICSHSYTERGPCEFAVPD